MQGKFNSFTVALQRKQQSIYVTNFPLEIFFCCEQSFTWLLRQSTYPSIHPLTQPSKAMIFQNENLCFHPFYIIFIIFINVVYFDQQTGILHVVCWSKSSFWHFNIFFHQNKEVFQFVGVAIVREVDCDTLLMGGALKISCWK